MTKKRSSAVSRKNWLTPSVAAPGDTHPSDATGSAGNLAKQNCGHFYMCGFYYFIFVRFSQILLDESS